MENFFVEVKGYCYCSFSVGDAGNFLKKNPNFLTLDFLSLGFSNFPN
jgi:hypothetical protein